MDFLCNQERSQVADIGKYKAAIHGAAKYEPRNKQA